MQVVPLRLGLPELKREGWGAQTASATRGEGCPHAFKEQRTAGDTFPLKNAHGIRYVQLDGFWTVGHTWGRWVNTCPSADPPSFLHTHLHQETVKALWAQLPSTPVHSGTFLGRAGLARASWSGPQCVGASLFPEFGGSGAAGLRQPT